MPSSWISKALGYIQNDEASEGDAAEDLVVLVQGKNAFNDKIYCYIRIPHAQFDEFKRQLQSVSSFDLREYGTIIAAGRGDPTKEVQVEITKEFGIKPATGGGQAGT